MKTTLRKKRLCLLLSAAMLLFLTPLLPRAEAKAASDTVLFPNSYMTVYRIWNADNGDHLYSLNAYECTKNINDPSSGWQADGVKATPSDVSGTAWVAPLQSHSHSPVHRIYNPNNGDHLYTMDQNEVNINVAKGWIYEGICWYSADELSCAANVRVPVYRLYNAFHSSSLPGAHHYTCDAAERAGLLSLRTADGRPIWQDEGTVWYGVPDQTQVTKTLDATRPVLTITEDTAYAQIEATVNVKSTAASGSFGKLVVSSSAGNLASFGVQYEANKTQQFPWYTKNADFLLENIYDPGLAAQAGTAGKYYLHLGQADTGVSYKLRLTWSKSDQQLRAYVNDKEVTYGYEAWTKTSFRPPFEFGVEGSAKAGGDSIDITFTGVKTKVGDGTELFPIGCGTESGTDAGSGTGAETASYSGPGWVTDRNYFGLTGTITDPGTSGTAATDGVMNAEAGKYCQWTWWPADTGKGYNASFRISGIANCPGGYDWDTSFSAVDPTTGTTGHPLSATVHISQARSPKAYTYAGGPGKYPYQ